MTHSTRGRLYELQRELHNQFERQTDELVKLTGYRTDPDINSLDPQTVTSLTASTRQALADTTEALQRMNDGTYGTCQHCGERIPVERLEILPSARYCVPCQIVHRG
jgi:DnaK suppressor protein